MPQNNIYKKVVNQQKKEVAKLTLEQQKEIAKIYEGAIKGLTEKLKNTAPNTLAEQQAYEMRKELKKAKKELKQQIEQQVKDGVSKASGVGTKAEQDTLDKLLKETKVLSTKAKIAMFSQVQSNIINDIVSGNLYKDNKTLSDRIWNYGEGFEKDLQYIISEAILEKKSAVELAQDLEKYVLPVSKRPTTWGKVYPNLKYKKVDYNAMRLARTSINHSYQTASIQASQPNPFVDGMQWQSALQHGRTCEICEDRHGKVFPKHDVPLDHPNGLCTMLPHISKTTKEIVNDLLKWYHGGENKELDKWYEDVYGLVKEQKKAEDSFKAVDKLLVYDADGNQVEVDYDYLMKNEGFHGKKIALKQNYPDMNLSNITIKELDELLKTVFGKDKVKDKVYDVKETTNIDSYNKLKSKYEAMTKKEINQSINMSYYSFDRYENVRNAFYKYTGSDFAWMNQWYRNDKTDELSGYEQKLINNMLTGFKVIPNAFDKDTELYRATGFSYLSNASLSEESLNKIKAYSSSSRNSGIDLELEEQLLSNLRKELLGVKVPEKSFTSTAYEKGAFGTSRPIQLTINAPADISQSVQLAGISKYGDSEAEILFKPGMINEIKDISFETSARGIRQLRVVVEHVGYLKGW